MATVDDRWHRTDGTRTARYGAGKRWQVRWRDPDGRARKESFAKRVEADRFRVRIEADLHGGTYVDPASGQESFDSYAASWLAARTSDPLTIEETGNRLRRYVTGTPLGRSPLNRIRPSTVQAWLSGLELAENTARIVFDHVSSILAAAVEDGVLARNPARSPSVRVPKRTRPQITPWTGEQVVDVADALPERYRPLVTLGAGLGLRPGEVFGLAVDDVDWLRGWVTVARQVKIVGRRRVFTVPKGGTSRSVPLPETVKQELAAYLAEFPATWVTLPWREPGSEPRQARLLLTNEYGRALHAATVGNTVWSPALRAVGLERNRRNGQHALRHYYASVLLDAGESIKVLAAYLGHTDPGFTLRTYTHLMPDSESRTRSAIDAAFLGSRSRAPHVPHSGS